VTLRFAISFRAGLSVALASPLAFSGHAQTPAPAAVATFEAASIKRNISGETRLRFETPPGRLTAVNVPLRFVIRQAYRVPEARIIGGPAWVDTERFDILSTAPASANVDTMREMLRTLLLERFGLVVHTEMREMPVYVLRLARTDATLGSHLRRSTTDCSGRGSTVVAGRVPCGIMVSQGPGSGSLRGGSATLDNFVRLLGDFLDRPLNDGTGLTGLFDLELQFTAERSSMPGAAVPGGLATASSPDDVPSVFTALREQMGLMLEARKGRADVWVIDAVSRPTPD
jgi:uncharacterized protein (TIGR03435 family)